MFTTPVAGRTKLLNVYRTNLYSAMAGFSQQSVVSRQSCKLQCSSRQNGRTVAHAVYRARAGGVVLAFELVVSYVDCNVTSDGCKVSSDGFTLNVLTNTSSSFLFTFQVVKTCQMP